MRTRADYWLVLVLMFNALVVASYFWELLLPFRGIVIFCFMLFAPGLSIAYVFSTQDTLTRIFIIIVVSVGIVTVVAVSTLYLGIWSPPGILVTLVVFCLLMVLVEIYLKIRYAKISTHQ